MDNCVRFMNDMSPTINLIVFFFLFAFQSVMCTADSLICLTDMCPEPRGKIVCLNYVFQPVLLYFI